MMINSSQSSGTFVKNLEIKLTVLPWLSWWGNSDVNISEDPDTLSKVVVVAGEVDSPVDDKSRLLWREHHYIAFDTWHLHSPPVFTPVSHRMIVR
jgi:hypothetical protein